MGTIIERKRANGKPPFLAQVVKKRNGRIELRKSKTFAKKKAARSWIDRIERDYEELGAMAAGNTSLTVNACIQKIVDASKGLKRTKQSTLMTLQKEDFGPPPGHAVEAADIITLALHLAKTRSPSTAGNILRPLSGVFALAEAPQALNWFDVIGIFPNDAAIAHLVGAPMLETNDARTVAGRYMSLEPLAPATDAPAIRLHAVAS